MRRAPSGGSRGCGGPRRRGRPSTRPSATRGCAAGRAEEAAAAFAAVLGRAPSYVPALVGAGSAASRRGDDGGGPRLLPARAGAGPGRRARPQARGLAEARRSTERRMARAQAALEANDSATAEARVPRRARGGARRWRRCASPSPTFSLRPRRDAGRGGRARGRRHRRPRGRLCAGRACSSSSATSTARRRSYRGLLEPRRRRRGRAGGPRRALATRARRRRCPRSTGESRRASRVTRADLAALVAARVKALRGSGPGEPRVAVDISSSWAREPIATVLALEVMDVYPNHTFQPGAHGPPRGPRAVRGPGPRPPALAARGGAGARPTCRARTSTSTPSSARSAPG